MGIGHIGAKSGLSHASALSSAAPTPSGTKTNLATPAPGLAPVNHALGTDEPSPTTAMIAAAALLKRSDGPEGTKPLLSRHERERLEKFFATSSPLKQTLTSLLESFGGPDRDLKRGLLLRAIGARVETIESHAGDLAVLDRFATEIASSSQGDVRRMATVLDLDSTTSTSSFDPLSRCERRGIIRAPASKLAKDNDGLFQRFTAACGPTVVQMMCAEADPVFSFRIHRAGLTSDSVTDGPAKFQKRLLEKAGGVALGYTPAQIRARLRNAVGRLRSQKLVSPNEAAAFKNYIEANGPLTTSAEKVLTRVRSRYDGFPNGKELIRVRASKLPAVDEGIHTDAMLALLDEHVTPATGVAYELIGNPLGYGRGQAWRYLDRVTDALRQGVNVPFGIAEPAHWMLMTHVKGNKPHRSFLVSDPDGGRTAWVRERDLLSGTFADKQFHLSGGDERPFVDGFLVPAC